MISEDFISVSEKIVGFGDAGSRSATSRAYYGVFNLALDIIAEVAGMQRHKFPSKHNIPQYCLQQLSSADAKEAEALIGNLQTRRIKADYKLNDPTSNSREFGMYSVEMGKECQKLLTSFINACRSNTNARKEFSDRIDSVLKNFNIAK